MRRYAGFMLACLAALIALPALSREEVPAEMRDVPFSGNLASCQESGTLNAVMGRFNAAERRFWNGEVEILSIEEVREVAFRPHGQDLIPRRYCTGVAVLSNATRTKVNFAIVEGMGFASLADGVQFCLVGYDRNHTAMGDCRRFDR
jgi:hypothetical protein